MAESWLTQFTLKGSGYISPRDRARMMEDPDETLDRIVGRDTYECGGRWTIGPFQRGDLKEAMRAAYRAGMHSGQALKKADWIFFFPFWLVVGFFMGWFFNALR